MVLLNSNGSTVTFLFLNKRNWSFLKLLLPHNGKSSRSKSAIKKVVTQNLSILNLMERFKKTAAPFRLEVWDGNEAALT